MKMLKSCDMGCLWACFAFMLAMVPSIAMAGEAQEWRPTYDLILRWVNFLILVAVIAKYAREPVKSFLNQQKADVASRIEALTAEKQTVFEEIQAAREQAAERESRLKELQDRLISQGEAKKQQIIEQARQQSTVMIEETRKKMETRISQVKNQLKMELADLAFEQAEKKLPKIITDSDNQRLLAFYMEGMHAKHDA